MTMITFVNCAGLFCSLCRRFYITFLTWKIDVGKIAPFRCIHVKRSMENGDSGSCSICSLYISRRSYYTVKQMNSLNDHWSYHGAILPITFPFTYLLILL